MTTISWIIFGLIVALVVIMILSFKLKKGKKLRPDYYSLFIMGVIWLPAGILMRIFIPNSIGNVFLALGAIYFVIGLMHKDEWRNNHRGWEQASKKEKKLKIILLIVLGFIVLAGMVIVLLISKGII